MHAPTIYRSPIHLAAGHDWHPQHDGPPHVQPKPFLGHAWDGLHNNLQSASIQALFSHGLAMAPEHHEGIIACGEGMERTLQWRDVNHSRQNPAAPSEKSGAYDKHKAAWGAALCKPSMHDRQHPPARSNTLNRMEKGGHCPHPQGGTAAMSCLYLSEPTGAPHM